MLSGVARMRCEIQALDTTIVLVGEAAEFACLLQLLLVRDGSADREEAIAARRMDLPSLPRPAVSEEHQVQEMPGAEARLLQPVCLAAGAEGLESCSEQPAADSAGEHTCWDCEEAATGNGGAWHGHQIRYGGLRPSIAVHTPPRAGWCKAGFIGDDDEEPRTPSLWGDDQDWMCHQVGPLPGTAEVGCGTGSGGGPGSGPGGILGGAGATPGGIFGGAAGASDAGGILKGQEAFLQEAFQAQEASLGAGDFSDAGDIPGGTGGILGGTRGFPPGTTGSSCGTGNGGGPGAGEGTSGAVGILKGARQAAQARETYEAREAALEASLEALEASLKAQGVCFEQEEILGGAGSVSGAGGILWGTRLAVQAQGASLEAQVTHQAQEASLEAQETHQAQEASLAALRELQEMYFGGAAGASGAGGIFEGARREAWHAFCRLRNELLGGAGGVSGDGGIFKGQEAPLQEAQKAFQAQDASLEAQELQAQEFLGGAGDILGAGGILRGQEVLSQEAHQAQEVVQAQEAPMEAQAAPRRHARRRRHR